MRQGTLDRRSFTVADQTDFAVLSGDWNPLHVDPVAARRSLFGEPLVHGVHLLLWALDRDLAASDGPVMIRELRVAFKKPARLNVPLVLEASSAGDETRLRVLDGKQLVCDVLVIWSAGPAIRQDVVDRSWAAAAPVELRRDEITTAVHGALELAVDGTHARARFPQVCARVGLRVVAELLATTRLVGMRCPGLHSLFGGMVLRATSRVSEVLEYEVQRATQKYSMVDLVVRGDSLEGTIEAYIRPEPQPGPSLTALRAAVTPGELVGQRALVVGGSRGLGEAIARGLALGGAEVCLTYHRGAEDAARIVDEIVAAGGRIVAEQLDVTQDAAVRWPFAEPPTHLYYLATPRIPAVGKLTGEDLQSMLRFYVTAFHAVVEATSALAKADLVVWTPSTVFLDSGTGSAAYTVAKAAMEELCRRLPAMLPVRVRCPRLPRIATDQTAGLIQVSAAPALDIALAEIRAAHALASPPRPT
ncbi:MAG: SDR family NAD(P)-dependent oxidoreductase [Myxococcota bacterium]|nr:SDR family NAD(P)-dependent oxidoreductase [Myxococcota bacterium]